MKKIFINIIIILYASISYGQDCGITSNGIMTNPDNPNNEDCGIADEIKASPDRAFCNVHWDCATGNFSFGHEIGHLIGCRHDTHVDPNITPREYAHGYVDVTNEFRTIMAYNNECTDNGVSCTRVLHFSNPNINFNVGGSNFTTGDETTANNARLLDEKFPNAMSYRQPANDLEIIQDNITNLEVIGDVIATNNIFNNGSVSIDQNQHLCLRSGNSIQLKPGFVANKGSVINASITEIEDCGESDGEASNLGGGDADAEDLVNYSKLQVSLYPNPVLENTVLSLKTIKETSINIRMYEFTGKILTEFNPISFSELYTIPINCSKLASGIYFLEIINNTDKSMHTIKFIKI